MEVRRSYGAGTSFGAMNEVTGMRLAGGDAIDRVGAVARELLGLTHPVLQG